MASVSTYLNFAGNTAAAFEFYRSVFGTQFQAPGVQRMADVPAAPGQPPMPEAAKNLVLHVALPILGGHVLHGTDALFQKLSAGGKVDMPMMEMFWGDYFGSFTDQFGMKWMINTSSKS